MKKSEDAAPGRQGQAEVIAVTERSALDEVLHQGALRLLLEAIEEEVETYIEEHRHEVDDRGHRLAVRNGHARERTLVTPVGPLRLRAPRVEDRRTDEHGQPIRFTSAILPPYLRRTKSVEELIPWLYLKGISTGDMHEALVALLGEDAPGLSASTVVRLKEVWRKDYDAFTRRDLSGERYVYLWADGIHCNVRLDDERQCFLVVIGATADGCKVLLAVEDGYRESALSWRAVLDNLRRRGLVLAPKLAVGDGALGFWAALAEVFPETKEQRCWVHKTANVLDKLPKGMHGKVKPMLQEVWMAESREAAHRAFDRLVRLLRPKYVKAAECLEKDREALLAFYGFPAEHWAHLRTTNPIESTFATVRHRQRRTKGCGSREASLTMVFMLARQAQRHWRRLNGSALLVHVLEGKEFHDGLLAEGRAA